jgi:uncharacterized SAM-binding protein YcdF (DUF218 family)
MAAGGLALLLAFVIIAFFGIGRWLVVEDPLVHVDVIVVLSGRLPDRALEAAQVYRAGFAPQVWISQPVSPADELRTMNINFIGEDYYNEKVLLARGVPLDAIHTLERPSANTEQEVREISEMMHRDNLQSAIVVTSKPHTRRVRAIWHKLVGASPRLIVRYADDDSYDGAHWWRHTQDALDTVREVLGLLNVWAGFPLRPSQS